MSSVSDTEILMAFYEHNTSQDKGWIFDSASTLHVCSQKKLFNFLIVKEEGTVKMVDDTTCGDSQCYKKRSDDACSGGGPICSRGTI